MSRNTSVRSGICVVFCASVSFALLTGCSGGGSTPTKPTSPSISVSVSPSTVSARWRRDADLHGEGANDSSNAGVTWSMGSGAGALSASSTTSVTYTAPSVISSATTVTLTATSIADKTTSNAATITLNPPPTAPTTQGPSVELSPGLTASGLMLSDSTDTVSPAANATRLGFPRPACIRRELFGDGERPTFRPDLHRHQRLGEGRTRGECHKCAGRLRANEHTSARAARGDARGAHGRHLGHGPLADPDGIGHRPVLPGRDIPSPTATRRSIPIPRMACGFSSGGVLSGTPFYTGLQPLAFSVSRADGASEFLQTELLIGGAGSRQSITNSPTAATQGQSYLWELQASWGYTGARRGPRPGALLVFGSIPPGLTFNPLNSTNGTFFGTPTMAGAYTITLMAEPGTTLCAPGPTNYKTVTLTIAPAASPTTPTGSSNWTRQGSGAVLTASNSGWDSYLVGSPSVIRVGSTYYMYYEGLNTTSFTHAIGLATSTDGVNWTKGSGAVLQATTDAWDSTEVRYPSVVNNAGNYLMVYQGAGAGTALGLATSTNGMNWTKHSGAVLTTQGVHSAYVPGTLLYLSGQYVLYYTVDGYIGRMTSTDGVSWNDGGAVFSPTATASRTRDPP